MSWIERRLAELADEGYFDDLPGSGRPIPDLGTEYSPTWWAARWIERDDARRSMKSIRQQIAADISVAAALPRPDARRRLEGIAAAVYEINQLLDSPQQLPEVDIDALLIRGHWG